MTFAHPAAAFARTEDAHPPAGLLARRINPAWLVAALLFGLGGANVLLLPFLGVTAPWLYALIVPAWLALCVAVARLPVADTARWPTAARLLAAGGIALVLLALGGEGRFFYANVDWQVRDAVLADMIRASWPFAYTARGEPEVLRAPIGMYLVPAIAGKLWGFRAADIALWLQNGAALGAILALASMLFATRRQRWIALGIFLVFSGMDAIGQALADPARLVPLHRHIDDWAGIQFSATLTMAFWVPQHAITGWLGAALFLLWRRGMLPLAGFLTPLPLLALWSPLGLIGTMPFAAYAGIAALRDRALRPADLLLPALSVATAAAALVYLKADAGTVGLRFFPVAPGKYVVFQLLETVPFLAAAWALGGAQTFGRPALAIVTLCLTLLPFAQIGENVDLMMRGSIPALAILALVVADVLQRPSDPADGLAHRWRLILVAALAVGALTPAREVARALIHHPAPLPGCSFFKSWDISYASFGKSTYLARPAELPAALRPERPALLSATEPAACYPRPWMTPRL